jgi:hypothetical protein
MSENRRNQPQPDAQQPEQLAERVDELEATVQRMLPDRRQFIKGAGVAAGAAALGFGTGQASAAPGDDGDTIWGDANNRDDYYADEFDANAVNAGEIVNEAIYYDTDEADVFSSINDYISNNNQQAYRFVIGPGDYAPSTALDISPDGQANISTGTPVVVEGHGGQQNSGAGTYIDLGSFAADNPAIKLAGSNTGNSRVTLRRLSMDDPNKRVRAIEVLGGGINTLLFDRVSINGAKHHYYFDGNCIRTVWFMPWCRTGDSHFEVTGSTNWNINFVFGGQFKNASQPAWRFAGGNINSFRAWTEFNNCDVEWAKFDDMEAENLRLYLHNEGNNSSSGPGLLSFAGSSSPSYRDVWLSVHESAGSNGPYINVDGSANLNSMTIANSYIDASGELIASSPNEFKSLRVLQSEIRMSTDNISAIDWNHWDAYTSSETPLADGDGMFRRYSDQPRYRGVYAQWDTGSQDPWRKIEKATIADTNRVQVSDRQTRFGGLLYVYSNEDSDGGLYRLDLNSVTTVSAGSAFSTTKDNQGTVNVYHDGNENTIYIENEAGGSRDIAWHVLGGGS